MIFNIYSPGEIKVLNVNAHEPPDAFYSKFEFMQKVYPDFNFKLAGGNNDKQELYISMIKLEEDACEELQSWLDEYINT